MVSETGNRTWLGGSVRRGVAVTVVGLALTVAAVVPGSGLVARQGEATPSTGIATPVVTLPFTPSAADCAVAPLPYDALPVIPIGASPVPATPGSGATASPEQIAVVVRTVEVQIGCVNAGDIPRALALTGGPYRASLLGQYGTPTAPEYAPLATPLPLAPAAVITIVSVDEVVALPDGTLSARVVTSSGPTVTSRVTVAPDPASPTGYLIVDLTRISRVEPSPDA